jgi:hypothetical protein
MSVIVVGRLLQKTHPESRFATDFETQLQNLNTRNRFHEAPFRPKKIRANFFITEAYPTNLNYNASVVKN